MAKKLEDIQKQIAKLKLEEAAILAKGRREAIGKINALLKEFQLTAADLSFGTAAAGKRGRRASTVRKSAAPTRVGAGVAKYRDPASGKTWTGFGKPPNWIKDAADRSAFLISSAGEAPVPGPVASGDPVAKAPAKRLAAATSGSKKPSASKKTAAKAEVPAKKAVAEKVIAKTVRAPKKALKPEVVAPAKEA